MKVSDFDYELPEKFIAQYPVEKRDHSRLMVLNRQTKTISHDYFFNLGKYLGDSDLVVINNTKVFPARLIGRKETGGKIELLLLRLIQGNLWEVLLKPAKRLPKGTRILFKENQVSPLTPILSPQGRGGLGGNPLIPSPPSSGERVRVRGTKRKFLYNQVNLLNPTSQPCLDNPPLSPLKLRGDKRGVTQEGQDGGQKRKFLCDQANPLTPPSPPERGRGVGEGAKSKFLCDQVMGVVEENFGEGRGYVRFEGKDNFLEVIEKLGSVPLPHYIKRDGQQADFHQADTQRYQTVYASCAGAVAAPTAGLHFTLELLQTLRENGTEMIEITLHVGPGTFRPLEGERIEDHIMEEERFYISPKAACSLNMARAKGKQIVAVGTTTTRVLETVATLFPGEIKPFVGSTGLYIYPGHKFHLVDKLITNFHRPGSTPLLLASAFAGKNFLFSAYQEAIRLGYRFFSFGDATLIV